MGIKDNFSQAMRELVNPKEPDRKSDKAKVKDVASYMDTATEQTNAENTGAANEQPVNEASGAQQNTAEGFNNRQNTFNAQQGNFGSQQNSFSRQDSSNQQSGFNGQQGGFGNANQSSGSNAWENRNQPSDRGFGGASANAAGDYSYGNDSYGRFPRSNAAKPENPFFAKMNGDPSQETTVISKNTVIDGNIRSFADMKVDGNIRGNVETTKDISINGKIIGNITCDNAEMAGSAIQGNVQLKGQIIMASDSMLIGDLTSQIANLNGKIKGNLTITGKIQLDRDSVVIGDITAGSIAVSDGAVIQGFVSTTYLSKEESGNIFPESIAFGE